MVKVEDIKNVNFRKSVFGGYKAFEVDSFADKILESYEDLQRENMRLLAQMEELKGKLAKYKEEESGIRNALLSAQKLADASLLDADNKVKSVLLEASRKADEIVSNAKDEVARQKEIAWDIRIRLEKFQNELIKICTQQIDEVKKIREDDENVEIPKGTKTDKNLDSDTQVVEVGNSDGSFDSMESNKHEGLINIASPSVNESVKPDKVAGDVRDSDILEDIYSGVLSEGGDSLKKAKLKNLKFGEKFRNGSHEFGKGLCAGLFRRKK